MSELNTHNTYLKLAGFIIGRTMDYQSFREFLDQKPALSELIKAFFGLNYVEYETFEILIKHDELNVSQIMTLLGRDDRVLVNRCLKKLRESDLVIRAKESRTGRRGYWYVYSLISLEELQNKMTDLIDLWCKHARIVIERMNS